MKIVMEKVSKTAYDATNLPHVFVGNHDGLLEKFFVPLGEALNEAVHEQTPLGDLLLSEQLHSFSRSNAPVLVTRLVLRLKSCGVNGS